MVEVDGIWKTYRHRVGIGIKELLVGKKKTAPSRFTRPWALQNVSFNVKGGEAFAIIGNNGTGKSTTLSLILGTILPDKGTIRLSGRVASLLELGAGFHPELTGKENIYLYGSILGMTIRQIRKQLPRIIEFSELGDAVDTPLRTYSSGMITRLGFATIIHAPADILLIDEVLAVGDASFQKKCRGFLQDFKNRNGSLIIVSHDMDELRQICDEGVCLNRGIVSAVGSIDEVIDHYRSRAAQNGENP
jgi:lipopolysaccharide transport system ATP-binding protein